MIERKWAPVAPIAFTSTGTSKGLVTVSSTLGFKVKQKVVLNHPSLPGQELEVKRVTRTNLELGPMGSKITDRSDLSAYDTTSFLYANEQNKSGPTGQETDDAVYEQEPTVANRVIQADPYGDFYTVQNPLPVQLSSGSINIDSLNADLNVQLSHRDNDPNTGDIADSVRIGDGTNTLLMNADGSLNVNVIESATVTTPGMNVDYQEQSSVAAAIETTIISKVASVGGLRLVKVMVSGENRAEYKVKIDGQTIAKKRTYYTNFNEEFVFENVRNGIELNPGQTLTITVIHTRPSLATFEASVFSI